MPYKCDAVLCGLLCWQRTHLDFQPVLCCYRVYSHQESPLFHLLLSGPNTMLSFFGAVGFHTALFGSEPETKLNHMWCLKSSIHWFIHSTVLVSVRLFGPHPSGVFTPAQKIHTKGGNQLEFDSIEPNKTGVNTPIMLVVYANILSPSTGEHYQQQAL